MKILVLIHSLGAGGAERVTANLANHWASKNWEVTVVTMRSKDCDFYCLHPNIKRIALNLDDTSSSFMDAIYNNIKRFLKVRRLIKEVKPEVALGMMTSSAITLVVATFGLRGVRVIASERIHPPMFPIGRVWSLLRRLTYPHASRVTMMADKGLDWLSSEIPKAAGVVMPNPITYPLPTAEPMLSPASVISPFRKMILAVGRLDHQKGFDLLLTAYRRVANLAPEWDLVILGEGPLRSALEAQASELEIAGRVHFPGRAGNVSEWYERADLYVMSSRFEGFPNTLGEAMAHGCAVISFDCDTGPGDLIRHNVDGLLVSDGDVEILGNEMIRSISDEKLRARLALNALAVRERFSMDRIADNWERLFTENVR